MPRTNSDVRTGRGLCFYGLVASLCLLAVLCACLVVTIVLLHQQFAPVVGPTAGNTSKTTSSEPPSFDVMGKEHLEPWAAHFRLPADVIPVHYDLRLHPRFEEGTFEGDVSIRLDVKNDKSFLIVNTKYLDIHRTELTKVADNGIETNVPVDKAFEYEKNEFWVVVVRDPVVIASGQYALRLSFRGLLTKKIVGFYRSIYTDPQTNRTRMIATSKFEPTYARQAFPCLDEPGLKANFTVRLVRPSGDGYSALSNMDVVEETPDAPDTGVTTVRFRTSVPMSTYVACFIVSDFGRLPPITTSHGFPVSVYAKPGQFDKTEYALQTASSIVEYYSEYFAIPYPLPKLDLIAIPDFVSGAMEHWGLITFRETNLLFDAVDSSSNNRERVASVVAHELAHMWFGNLMTMKWWDDLWLNEGFATYMSFKGVNSVHRDWQMGERFITDELHPVLTQDAVLSSHPIVQKVGHPDEITEIFDSISYSKGASVIRMLEDFLGEDIFRQGISDFLRRFEFSNAMTQDLWDALQEVAGDVNVTHVMDTWTRQMGFPVVTVSRDGNGRRVLCQQRFLADPEANVTDALASPFGYRWDIPITYIEPDSSQITRLWLYSDVDNVTLKVGSDIPWVKINSGQNGYYRVNYPLSDWKTLASVLSTDITVLPSVDRANLLDDVFALADAGLLPYSMALDWSKTLSEDTALVTWTVASQRFKSLKGSLQTSMSYSKFRTFVRGLVQKMYQRVTWTASQNDSHVDRLLRERILSLACSMGHPECIREVGVLFSTWIVNPEKKLDPDLRQMIYRYGMASVGGEEEWDKMWELYLHENNVQEKVKLLHGLGMVSQPWLLSRFIELAKDEANVRSQDFFNVLLTISENPIGNPIVWEFVRSQWPYLVERFTLNNRYLGSIIPRITRQFASDFKLAEMKTFFAQYPEAGAGKMARKQALEAVTNNIKWLKRHSATVEQWLTSNSS